MNLRDFLHFNNLTLTEFAQELKIHANYLSAIARGARKPSELVAQMIELKSKGKVTAEEVMNQQPIKKKKRKKTNGKD